MALFQADGVLWLRFRRRTGSMRTQDKAGDVKQALEKLKNAFEH
ncbi:hypothetical protein [Streptomyces sp900116325]|uniref:Uncharacterized protein n=1 Tax=Streptomyces sp. 900116325 TaxID=3154295 RepID=A0ABV2UGL5_9ACTN